MEVKLLGGTPMRRVSNLEDFMSICLVLPSIALYYGIQRNGIDQLQIPYDSWTMWRRVSKYASYSASFKKIYFFTLGIEACLNRLKLEICSQWLLAGDHFHRTNCWRRKPNGGCPSWLLKGIELAPSFGSSRSCLSRRLAASKEPWCHYLYHMRNTSKVQEL